MRIILLRLGLFSLIQVGVGLLVFPTAFSMRRPGYLAALEDKIQLLEAEGEQPRLIFVGGSSVAFGIRSPLFEERLDQPAINLGLHASLGLDLYLRLVERHARKGDAVVLLPEYAMLFDDMEMTPENVRRTLRNCPEAVSYLHGNLPSVKNFLDRMALSEVAYWTQKGSTRQQNNVKRIARRMNRSGNSRPPVRRLRKSTNQIGKGSVYRRASFNRQGDMVAHHGRPGPDKLAGVQDYRYRADTVLRVTRRLNLFADRCRKRGVDLYFAYPPIPDTEFRRSNNSIRILQGTLRQELSQYITVLNSPQDVVYSRSLFFDTVTHLSEAGKNERSQMLLQQLVPAIAARRDRADRWR